MHMSTHWCTYNTSLVHAHVCAESAHTVHRGVHTTGPAHTDRQAPPTQTRCTMQMYCSCNLQSSTFRCPHPHPHPHTLANPHLTSACVHPVPRASTNTVNPATAHTIILTTTVTRTATNMQHHSTTVTTCTIVTPACPPQRMEEEEDFMPPTNNLGLTNCALTKWCNGNGE